MKTEIIISFPSGERMSVTADVTILAGGRIDSTRLYKKMAALSAVETVEIKGAIGGHLTGRCGDYRLSIVPPTWLTDGYVLCEPVEKLAIVGFHIGKEGKIKFCGRKKLSSWHEYITLPHGERSKEAYIMDNNGIELSCTVGQYLHGIGMLNFSENDIVYTKYAGNFTEKEKKAILAYDEGDFLFYVIRPKIAKIPGIDEMDWRVVEKLIDLCREDEKDTLIVHLLAQAQEACLVDSLEK